MSDHIDIDYIRRFASENNFGLTGKLNHADVKILAESWLPKIYFHENELFHPISLRQYQREARDFVDAFPSSATSARDLYLIDGHLPHEIFQPGLLSRERMADFEDPRIDEDAYVTALKDTSLDIAKEIYGATDIIPPVDGVLAYKPRYPIKIMAEFRMLRESIKHYLLASADGDYPSGGSERRVLDAVIDMERITGMAVLLGGTLNRHFLLQLITAAEDGDSDRQVEILDEWAEAATSPGGDAEGYRPEIEQRWNFINSYGFLHYYFIYAYNNLRDYEPVFGNKHEGDVEGCCLVFDRAKLEEIDTQTKNQEERTAFLENTDNDPNGVLPKYIMTQAHEPWQGLDEIKKLTGSPEDIKRDDLNVYVAIGSHGSYLTPGPHDLNEVWETVFDSPISPWIAILCASSGLAACLTALLLFAIVEHLADTDDNTSTNGSFIGPDIRFSEDELDDDRNQKYSIETTPLSREEQIYNDGPFEDDDIRLSLEERAFPGRWGGDHGIASKSPRFINKTSRFLNKLRLDG